MWHAVAFTPAPVNVALDRPVSGYGLRDAFPGMRFEQPVAVVSAPGETDRVFVVERKGVIWAITNLNAPTRSIFLDLSRRTTWDVPYNESGCLGLAFHPGFKTNGYFFVYRVTYTSGEYGRDTLSRFTASGDRSVGDPASEFVLFAQRDVSVVHNAGCLRFGPDGYLYFSIGEDGPPAEFQLADPQAINKGMFGGIFRIDVDNRPGNLPANAHPDITPGAYKIPADNPWVGATNFLGKAVDPAKVRTEFYAVGLRNPWQFSIDSATGDIYCGDVGEAAIEEINLIKRGKNYGHPFFQGWVQELPHLPPDELTAPVHFYYHGMSTNTGSAVIGGLVVRSRNTTGLYGAYVFGDFGSGNIWKLRRQPQLSVEGIACEPGLAAFGVDPLTGEVLVVNVGEGTIRRLVYVAPDVKTVPPQLSQTGIFTDLQTLAIAPGYVPYDINVAFWSDGARKQRWFGLTDASTRYGFVEDANWNFPKGAVWVKHFELEMVKGDPTSARRLETRLLIKDENEVYGFTYRWGTNRTDAQLVPSCGMDEAFEIHDGGTIRTQVWRYPSRGECHSCHSRNAGFAAGFNTQQLNHIATHDGVTQNELTRLAALGYLDRAPVDPTRLWRLSTATDVSQPLEHRVKSYFAANCAICHHPDGLPIKARWDARITTPLDSANIVDGPVSQPFYSWDDDRVVKWRNVTNSVLVQRLANFDPWTYHMPPFASSVVNEQAIDMLTTWISTLPEPAWKRKQIGEAALFGSVAQTTNSLIIGAAGQGDSPYLTYRSVTNNFQIVARIKSVAGMTAGFSAGVTVRANDQAGSRFAALLQDASGVNTFNTSDGMTVSPRGAGFPWQRLVRDGARVAAFESADGQNWLSVGQRDGWSEPSLVAGFAVSSGDPWAFATVEFDHYSIASVSLDLPQKTYSLPAAVAVTADASAVNTEIQKVEFWTGERLLAAATNTPLTFGWTNAMAGDYTLKAIAFTKDSLSITSAPIAVVLTVELPSVVFVSTAAPETPHWQPSLGNIGYVLPAVTTNLPAGTAFATGGATFRWQSPANIGLDDSFGNVVATGWKDPQGFTITLAPAFEDPYMLTLCIADYGAEGCQEEITILSDTGVVLGRRIENQFTVPRFIKWAARGGIQIRIHSLNSSPAYLSGIFIDPVPLSDITLVSPLDGDRFQLPENIILRAEARTSGGPLRRVEFYDHGMLLASLTNAPYELVWTNALAGPHNLSAVAIGYFGRTSTSAPVSIDCDLPQTQLTFTGIDGLTRGNWPRVFGADGFALPFGPAQFRPFARIEVQPWVGLWEWISPSDDPRAMVVANADSPLATCWYSSFRVEATVNFLDGREHPFALYFLDYERVGAKQLLQIFDANSNELLSEYPLDDMGEGVFLTWNLRGAVRFTAVPETAWSAILSGIFVGGPISDSQLWWAKHFGGDLLATPKWTDDPDNDGAPNLVEYAVGSNPLAAEAPPLVKTYLNGRFLRIDINAVQIAPDVNISAETSTDVAHWQPVSLTRADVEDAIRLTTPALEGGAHFYRLRFDLR